MAKYHIVTYGCQMNVHESEKLAGILESFGYEHTDRIDDADAVFFNTCCIRENAEQRAMGNIGSLKQYKRKNPHVLIGVVGCMMQQAGAADRLKRKFPFVDIILGTHNLTDLNDYLSGASEACKRTYYQNTDEHREGFGEESEQISRTSFPHAWINIIYGCNNFCTYCIVPYVRGRERSRKFDLIIREAEGLLQSGYKEITLLGQNVNSYGNDLGKNEEFSRLLKTLAELPYKYRLKFMTSHPKDLSDRVIDTIAGCDNIAKSIHLPMQSGSDRILAQMNRKYDSAHYLSLIDKIRQAMPYAGISTDIMVGFPGETEEDFEATLNIVRKAQFSNAFTFIYSRRSGTVADKMENQIDEKIKSERIGRLIKVQNEISMQSASEYFDKTYEVLLENLSEKPGYMSGRTDCGRLVNIPFDEKKIGQFANVKITKTGIASLWGELI